MRELTILHVESHDQWAGQERRVVSECRWMREKGHRVHLAATPGTPVFERAKRAGVEVHPARFRNRDLPAAIFRIRGLIRRLRPDVLNPHGNRDSKAALLAAWGMGVPCVIRSRHMSAPVRNTRFNRLLYRRRCHRVLTTSRAAAGQLVRDLGVPPERVHFVPSGIVPPEALPDRGAARRELSGAWKIPPDAFWIGFVGRLSPEKGVDRLIEAVAALAWKRPELRLILAGRGGELERLRNVAIRRGVEAKVIFPGFQEDPWPCHRAMDLEVLPSVSGEGVPQSLLEAMYAGCPVVGSRNGGIPDIVLDGETGLLMPAADVEGLVQALEKAMDDPEGNARRAAAARRMVEENHTIHVMGHTLLRIYQSVFSGENRLAPGENTEIPPIPSP
jgi:glycosyltransferase involved in cell wall biosynthesis